MGNLAQRRVYEAPRRREGAERTRAAVLAAFHDLVFEHGVREATIRRTAERAGVSAETIYKSFGSKPQLVKALWDVTVAGDDAPMAMTRRPALLDVLSCRDLDRTLELYAQFVRGVHERLAPLHRVLTQTGGPELGPLLAETDDERRRGLAGFTAHLAEHDLLPAGVDRGRLADAGWALTSPHLFTQLTLECGWSPKDYQRWLATTLRGQVYDHPTSRDPAQDPKGADSWSPR